MNLIECIKMAFTSMKANKMRTFLTMLGIIIGISSVINITTIGNTIEKTVSDVLFSSGASRLLEVNVLPRDVYASNLPQETKNDYITENMLEGLSEKYNDRFIRVDRRYYDSGKTINDSNEEILTDVSGIYEGYLKLSTIRVIRGRTITERDNEERRMAAVVSEVFEKQYCGDESIIGKTIKIDSDEKSGISVTVVGIYKDAKNLKKFEIGDRSIQTEIYIPYQSVLKLDGVMDANYSWCEYICNIDYDIYESEELMAKYFDKYYEDNEYYHVLTFNYAEDFKYLSILIKVLSTSFAVIGAISLIVGGVGVMNIMLVSVVERTSEIGIRKALGAKSSSIKRQFVTEAVIICIIGGIIGILLGLGSCYLLGVIANALLANLAPDMVGLINIIVEPSVTAIIISVVCSVLIGAIFGSSPAKRAAKMNPIDALRYE